MWVTVPMHLTQIYLQISLQMKFEEILMKRPVAFKLAPNEKVQVFRIQAEPIDTTKLSGGRTGPAIVVTRKATILDELTTGLVDADDILAAQEGDWSTALLIVVDDSFPAEMPSIITSKSESNTGDEAFISSLEKSAPHLVKLGKEIIDLIRANGVAGELVEKAKGRWVNSPLNSFTLKAQPRVSNIQFTLYGEPGNYDVGEFLRKDQNSYSRGWVKDSADAKILAGLAKAAHERRQR